MHLLPLLLLRLLLLLLLFRLLHLEHQHWRWRDCRRTGLPAGVLEQLLLKRPLWYLQPFLFQLLADLLALAVLGFLVQLLLVQLVHCGTRVRFRFLKPAVPGPRCLYVRRLLFHQ